MTSDPTVIALLITTSAGFLTTIVNQVFQARKQASDREYDRQERLDAAKMLDEQAQEKARDLKLQVETRASVLEEMAKQTAAKISSDLAVNTALTVKGVEAAKSAYTEANNVNQKIAESAERTEAGNAHLERLASATSDSNDRIRKIEAVTVSPAGGDATLVDTNKRVRNIEAVVDHAPMLDPNLKHAKPDGEHAVAFKPKEETTA